MRRFFAGSSLVSVPVLLACVFSPAPALSQGLDSARGSASSADESLRTVPSPFAGKWSYRSFRSDPDLSVEPNSLLFGSGTMELALPTSDQMTGILGGEGWQLALSGGVSNGKPATIRFQGKGTIGGEQWVYDYIGFLVPPWPNGVGQRPAIVGSIVRTVSHSGGSAPAGYVAQWIAVRQDQMDARNSLRGEPAPARTAIDVELRDLETRWAAAVETNNPDQIGRFFTDDFLFVGAGGVLQDRRQHLDDFRTGTLKVESVAITEFTSHAYEDFAVVNTKVHVRGKLGERDITGDYRFMDTWRLIGQKWLAVARQQTRITPTPSAGQNRSRAAERPTPSESKPGTPYDTILRQKFLEEGQGTRNPDSAATSPSRPAAPRATPSAGQDRSRMGDRPTPYESKPETNYDTILRQKYREEGQGARNPNSAAASLSRQSASRAAAVASLRPATISSANGRLDVTLDVAYGTVRIGQDDVSLRMYNQQLVGPVLRAKAGDTLYITLNNRLPLEPPGPHGGNGHHEWNTTNLHFHGLHVEPQGPPGVPDAESDNVLLELGPSAPFDPAVSTQKYQVKIPANHVAGTFWYHAHKHGAVAAQVSSGMAGALIIERDDAVHNLDSVAEVADAAQEVMVLQEIPYLKGPGMPTGAIERSPDTDPNPNQATMFAPGQWKALKRYITVNGEKIPTVTMAPGEIRRLRLVYTGQRESVQLRIERAPGATGPGPDEIPLHEIAVDGLPAGSIRRIDRTQTAVRDRILELFPGYRSDVLVQAPPAAAGDYYLVDTRWDSGGTPRPDKGADGSPELLRWVAKIVVAGSPVSMSMPDVSKLRPQRLDDLQASAVTGTQFAFYGLFLPPGQAIGYFISRNDLSQRLDTVSPANAKEYDPDPTKARPLVLGKTERWLVGSRNDNANVTHPFHIHINPFLITKVTSLVEPGSPGAPVDVTAREIGSPVWRDTLGMKQGFTYELLTRYDDFAGSFVNHCHILDHEDNGMMELVTITGPGTPTPGPVPRSEPVARADAAGRDRPRVLMFVKGSFCPECMAQVTDMAKGLDGLDADVVVVSSAREDNLNAFPKVPFKLVTDPTHELFRRFGAFKNGEPLHATVVIDRAGKTVLKEMGKEPFMDVGVVRRALAQAQTVVAIAVRNTETSDDDYLSWAPTPCQIRMVNGSPGGPDINVTLTNDPPQAIPDGGDVRFATTLNTGETATLESITVSLKQDGTPVNFYTAGFKASKLTASSLANKGRDAVIEVHQGDAAGPLLGTAAVMVRVRKALRHPSDPRPKLSDFELSEFLKALRDLHQIDDRFEWYVRLHRLATGHGRDFGLNFDPPTPQWPDQAHAGAGFIAWHRAFLLQFERELQVRYPHVALPYWVQGTLQNFFADDRLGAPGNATDVVAFRKGFPLYGWSISLPMDRGAGSDAMGLLRRRPLDHNDPGAPVQAGNLPYRQWTDLASLTGISRFAVFKTEETNPHNNGHLTIGPDGMWMYNCRESNADPVFYLFHCNQDYLWAKWQYELDRFVNDSSDPTYFSPADAFMDNGANRTVALGHHLKDTMWPWDGSTGQVLGGVVTSNRPTTNGFGEFPASRVPLLWPPSPAQPKPANMIDYQGVMSMADDLGFCYDDLPFGARPAPPSPLVEALATRSEDAQRLAVATVSDRSAGADTRLLALRSLRPGSGTMSSDAITELARITASRSEAPTCARRRCVNCSLRLRWTRSTRPWV